MMTKLVTKVLFLAVILLMTFITGYMAWTGHPAISALCALFSVGTLYVFMRKSAYPLRFMYPGLVTFFLFLVLPIVFTVMIGFTNLSTGHLLDKASVKDLLMNELTVDESNPRYLNFVLEKKAGDNYFVIATDSETDKKFSATFSISTTDPVSLIEDPSSELVSESLSRGKLFRLRKELKKIRFVLPSKTIVTYLKSNLLVNVVNRFEALPNGQLKDTFSGTVYRADDSIGSYVNGSERLSPGYYVGVGFDNFKKLILDPSVKESFLKILLWTMIWAAGSVALSFSLGIFLALVVNNKNLQMKAIYRVLLIIPYSIPFFISILVFRGLLNKDFGIINEIIVGMGFDKVNWLGDPLVAKISCLLVNLWLGFPYMFLVTTGILQSIPDSVYEAASLDGAKKWATFRHITLPMTFSAVAPLLVGSFAFNLNNFVGIYLLTGGGPPIPGATTPAGETDILISYTYRLAFEGGSGQDFGLASSIALIIFGIITVLTLINFKVSGMFNEKKSR